MAGATLERGQAPSPPVAAALAQLRAGAVDVAAARLSELASQDVLAGRRAQARSTLDAALAIAPNNAVLLARAAGLRQLEGDAAGSEQLARRALAGNPGEAMAATLLIDALVDRAACSEAIAIGEACLARTPNAPHVRRALSRAYLFAGRAHDACSFAKRAADELGANPSAIASLLLAALYDERLNAPQLAALHHIQGARLPPDPPNAKLAPRPPLANRALRLGVLSADLNQHPVGLLAEPLLRELDRTRFEPYVYARVAHADALTHRLKLLPIAWRDCATMSDTEMHAAMQADRIDVLLDLSGYTHGGRPRLLAARAAPVQIGWLGYPFGTGLKTMDYLVGDAQLLPLGSEPLYGERLLRLPGCFVCAQPLAEAPPVAPSPALIRGAVTFGSLNNLAKLSERTVALWSEILRHVPDSRLMLCAHGLGDAGVRQYTQQRFAAHGVDARRVALLPPRDSLAEFLGYYDSIDIGLDPLPFNGGVTTLQALWQGVPTVTAPGRTFAARMGASIMHAAGFDEFIARDAADYVAITRRWAGRIAELARLREGLRARLAGSALFDAPRFARAFGDAVAEAARRGPR
jgi:predicted O-linked N-acetylglucosamine transferase (SPINDLY family)